MSKVVNLNYYQKLSARHSSLHFHENRIEYFKMVWGSLTDLLIYKIEDADQNIHLCLPWLSANSTQFENK